MDSAKRMGKAYSDTLDRSKLSGQQEAEDALDRDIGVQGFSQGETATSKRVREQFLSDMRGRKKTRVSEYEATLSSFDPIPLEASSNPLDGDIDDKWLHESFNSGASIAATPKGREMTRAIKTRDRSIEISNIAKESGISKSEARREWQEREFKKRLEQLRSEGRIDSMES